MAIFPFLKTFLSPLIQGRIGKEMYFLDADMVTVLNIWGQYDFPLSLSLSAISVGKD